MKKLFIATVVFFALCVPAVHAADAKFITHIATLPLIEGLGAYSSITCMVEGEYPGTRIAGTVNLGLLAANAGLGVITMFSKDEHQLRLSRIHRIAGFGISAASIWLAAMALSDEGLDRKQARYGRYAACGYAVTTFVPIVMFSF